MESVLELTEDEAECFTRHGYFACYRQRSDEWPLDAQVHTSIAGTLHGSPHVVAIQEAIMRTDKGDIQHGYLYLFAETLKPLKQQVQGITLILSAERALCYNQYGFVILPFIGGSDLPIGGGIRFLFDQAALAPGIIVAVQRFQPTWNHLFFVKRQTGL